MVNVANIDREAFQEVWNEILSIMQSMETDKQALKNAKNELGTIIGAENAKETSALVKALLKKEKDGDFYDSDIVSAAEEVYEELLGV